MDYTLQTITIRTHHGRVEVPAMVAQGTGLAYHLEHDCHGESRGYVLTHVASGYTLVEHLVEDPEQAERWIELVSKFVDWNKGLMQLKKYKTLSKKIKNAHMQVLRESLISA